MPCKNLFYSASTDLYFFKSQTDSNEQQNKPQAHAPSGMASMMDEMAKTLARRYECVFEFLNPHILFYHLLCFSQAINAK